jgi:hypothetical protein
LRRRYLVLGTAMGLWLGFLRGFILQVDSRGIQASFWDGVCAGYDPDEF